MQSHVQELSAQALRLLSGLVTRLKWLHFLAIFFSLGWLLPTYVAPWLDFQQDAWVACASLAMAVAVLLRTRGTWRMPLAVLVLLLLALVPLVQRLGGLIAFDGVAWMSSAYLFGFALVVWCGDRWDSVQPGEMLDGLFLAILCAALATVWIQAQQWLGLLRPQDWWALAAGPVRPAGNFGQPNQAATFLAWGLSAVAWGATRMRTGWFLSLSVAAVLLWGVALTGSRTAWLAVLLVVGATFIWRRLWPNPRVPFAVAGLGVYFFLSVAVIAWLATDSDNALNTGSAYARLQIWQMSIDALRTHPFLGFGWNQTFTAQLAVADRYAPLHAYLSSSHNLVLDLWIWCGLVLGSALAFAIVIWLVRLAQRVRRAQEFVLLVTVGVVLNHAMLELPLHYAYLLLPTGWVLGALESRLSPTKATVMRAPRWTVGVLVLSAALLLWAIIDDYVRLGSALQKLRMENSSITVAPWSVPEVRVLDQMAATIEFMRESPTKSGQHETALARAQDIASLPPGGAAIILVAGSLAVNQKPEKAQWWLKRFCPVVPERDCVRGRENWRKVGQQFPEIAAIPWPEPLVEVPRAPSYGQLFPPKLIKKMEVNKDTGD